MSVRFTPNEAFQYYMFANKVLVDDIPTVTLAKQMEDTVATVALSGGAESIKVVTQVLFWMGLVF